MKKPTTFGARLCALRLARSFTQAKLAKRTGFPLHRVSADERGVPSHPAGLPGRIFRYAKTFSADPRWLEFGSGVNPLPFTRDSPAWMLAEAAHDAARRERIRCPGLARFLGQPSVCGHHAHHDPPCEAPR